MRTIQARVNTRLLDKASRLFTGTLDGRIIEVLQNARRAGATEVKITNKAGWVTVRDNGRGIEDFSKLLDLGGSGWDDTVEASEDPAGVGLFSLAPREVTIRSNGKRVTIRGDGWTGAPVDVVDDNETFQGTVLTFQDEEWDLPVVEPHAIFSGMSVIANGKRCPRETFLSSRAAHYPDLGCRIEVVEGQHLTRWHNACRRGRYDCNVLVNFHGQTVWGDCHPVDESHLHFLVDMTGEPTGIRLMLPARTCLVENEALVKLKAAMEVEAFRYLQRRGHHRLPYKQYLRAGDLGVQLPEAQPVYRLGTLTGDDPAPIQVSMPEGFPLSKCYRFDPDFKGEQADPSNTHLLGALSKCDPPFVPVDISKAYDGYSWAKLPTIGKVELKVGKTLQETWVWGGKLVCVDSIVMTAHTSDGCLFRSPVCMAVSAVKDDEEILVTPEARERLGTTDILYHLGGFSDEGDTWQTQEAQFEEELDHFWSQLVGPDENFRLDVFRTLLYQRRWRTMTVFADGRIKLRFKNGSTKLIRPAQPAKATK